MSSAEEWIALLKKEAAELRRLGILSIGCDGHSAVLAPADASLDKDDKASDTAPVADDEPANPWENKASYPTGEVPTFGAVDPVEKLPEIPLFGDD